MSACATPSRQLSTLRPPETQPIGSFGLTGRPSPSHQAQIVRALAIPALEAVERLIADQGARARYGGPVDTDQEKALKDLLELHAALGELIRLVDAARPIEGIMGQLAILKRRAIAGFARNLTTDSAALPGTISTFLVGLTTIGITQLLIGNEVAAVAMGGMAAPAFPKLRPVPEVEKAVS